MFTHLKIKVSLSYALIPVTLMLGTIPAYASEDTEAKATAEFNLNASVTDGLGLNRNDLINQPATGNAFSKQSMPTLDSSTPTTVAAMVPPLAAPSVGASQRAQTRGTGNAPLETGVSVAEYGIDWAPWMSALADRWYFQLRRLELQSPYDFYTYGPAQIQFSCYPNGQIGDISILRSCGIPEYDQMQVMALLASTPLPPFPRGTQRNMLTLCQGWEAHARRMGEPDYRPGSFGRDTPLEMVRRWE